MQYQIYIPPPRLQPYVECFWSLELPDFPGDTVPERVLPDGTTELIVHYGDQFERMNEKGLFEKQALGLFVGQMKTFTLLRPSGKTGMVAVRFKPAGAARFFGFSLSEITNRILDLDLVLGAEGKSLVDWVLNCQTNSDRVQVLLDFLLEKLTSRSDDLLLRATVKFIEEAKGGLDLFVLEKRIGLSSRQIERKFKEKVGISPMALARVVRFQRFLSLAKECPNMNLTDASMECGYYDQSHFIKDFRAFAGVSPSSFLEEKHPISDFFTSDQ